MNGGAELLFGLGAIVALVILIWIISKITSKISPGTKKDYYQNEVNRMASEPTYAASGNKGCKRIFMFIILIGILFLALLLASKGGFDFHP